MMMTTKKNSRPNNFHLFVQMKGENDEQTERRYLLYLCTRLARYDPATIEKLVNTAQQAADAWKRIAKRLKGTQLD
jgi:hypothetical protein